MVRKVVLSVISIVMLSLLHVGGALALPTNIISVSTTDPGSIGQLSVDPSNVLATAWYVPQASHASISISFGDLFPNGGAYSAYLMNGIGSQGTLANQLAYSSFNATTDISSILLWSDVVLDPGWLYLVVGTTDQNSYGGWAATKAPTVTTAPGVSQGDLSGVQFYSTVGDVNLGYLPASNFAIDELKSGQLMYEVTAVPEPGSFLLFGVGVAVLAARRWSRKPVHA